MDVTTDSDPRNAGTGEERPTSNARRVHLMVGTYLLRGTTVHLDYFHARDIAIKQVVC
jgi:hypothetical protein